MEKKTKIILITGYTGLIAQHFLKSYGSEYQIRFLSTNKSACNKKDVFHWNTREGIVDEAALENLDGIIHMSGYSILKPWTDENKIKMYDSRVKAAQLLYDVLTKRKQNLDFIVSFSAIGWYGYERKGLVNEDSSAGEGFVADLCKDWEEVAHKFTSLHARVVIPRVSLVLSKNGGFIASMKPIFKFGLGSALASGRQPMPWIHVDDLCGFIHQSIQDNALEGPYNMVAPDKQDNLSFSKMLAKAMGKPFFMPKVPTFALKLVFGKRTQLLIHSPDVESNRLKNTGYKFRYASLESALKEVFEAK